VAPVAHLRDWLPQAGPGSRLVLSLSPGAAPLGPASGRVISLSGPEGGLSASEEDLARQHGFLPTALGPRVLRADTAPLALLAYLGLSNCR
jgi:16S rRNA (uracil1498-N3)-methyltransferase